MWSDHKAVLFSVSRVSHHRENSVKEPQVCRAWSKVEANKLQEQLISTTEAVPLDLEEASVWYTSWLEEAANRLAPKKVTQFKRTRPSAPWYTQELRQQKLSCKQIERKWRKDYSESAKQTYKSNIRQYKELLDKTKKEYFTNKINSAKSAPKELFSIVNSVVRQPEPPIQASQELCDKIANFFLDKVETIF